jgi:mono/diheme cytochrome c family protein
VVRLTLAMLAVFGVVITLVAMTQRAGGSTKVVGDPARGKVLFEGYCVECHALKAVGSTARLGPDLDIMKPTYAMVVHRIVTGGTQGAGLPPTARLTFGPGIHEFAKSDILDIAAFVYLSTNG